MRKKNLLHRAKQYCSSGKHRFTQPREQVLAVLANMNEPMGAYQILEILSSGKRKINPPTVYRAIDFWEQHGFIHRIQSMNAYITCCEHDHHENLCIFICDNCKKVAELHMESISPLSSEIERKHFKVASSNTEVHGACNDCKLNKEYI